MCIFRAKQMMAGKLAVWLSFSENALGNCVYYMRHNAMRAFQHRVDANNKQPNNCDLPEMYFICKWMIHLHN